MKRVAYSDAAAGHASVTNASPFESMCAMAKAPRRTT
jgi:hypothetical protein